MRLQSDERARSRDIASTNGRDAVRLSVSGPSARGCATARGDGNTRMSIEEVRDIVIVVGGAVTLLFLLIAIAFAVYLFLLYRRTRRGVARLRGNDIDP